MLDETLQDRCDAIRPRIQALQDGDPVATVGLPAYNEQGYLLPALEALADIRTLTPLKFIAVDNASTDATPDILQQCGFEVITERQKGTSYARQALVEAARGKVLIQTDADTLVPSTWIEAHMKKYEDDSTIAVSGSTFSPEFHWTWRCYTRMNATAHQALATAGIKPVPIRDAANFSALLNSLRQVGGYEAGFNDEEDRLLGEKLRPLGTIVRDTSECIAVQVDGRRFDSFSKVWRHQLRRWGSRDVFKRVFQNAPTNPKDFTDIR